MVQSCFGSDEAFKAFVSQTPSTGSKRKEKLPAKMKSSWGRERERKRKRKNKKAERVSESYEKEERDKERGRKYDREASKEDLCLTQERLEAAIMDKTIEREA